MTRQHFKAIAAVVAAIEDETIRWAVANNFARELAAFNPNFKRDRFMTACNA